MALKTVSPMMKSAGREILEGDDADRRRAEQDELHQVAVLAQERAPARLRRLLGQAIWPVLLAPPDDVGIVEPAGAVGAERPQRLVGRESVPGDRFGRRRFAHRGSPTGWGIVAPSIGWRVAASSTGGRAATSSSGGASPGAYFSMRKPVKP